MDLGTEPYPKSPCDHLIPFCRWYGVGGTIQLALFAMVAAKVKMNANGAHTFLEVYLCFV